MKKLIAGLLILTIVLMVTACQSRAQNTPFYATPSVTYSDNSSGPPSAPTTGLESTSPAPPVIVTQVPPPEITLQIPAAASSKGGNYVQSPVTVASVPVIAPTPPSVSTSDAFERMIVRTGIIQIVVEDIQASIGNINGLTGSFNGYVVNSKTWQVGDATQGSISVRVPAESYFTVLEAVRAMAVKVKAENTAATDVTDQYVDLTSQLTNLQASEQQLLTIMEKAGSVTEILNVQNQLSSTRSQIERIKGQMNYIEHTSATSLLQIDLEQSKLFATIVVDRTVVQAQDLITFRANVSGGFTPYSYEWDFGDGATSTNVMPVHAYRGAGDYTVKLTD